MKTSSIPAIRLFCIVFSAAWLMSGPVAAFDAGLGAGAGVSFGAAEAGGTVAGSISGAGGIGAAARIGGQTLTIGQAYAGADTVSVSQGLLNLHPLVHTDSFGLSHAQTIGEAKAGGSGGGTSAGVASILGGESSFQVVTTAYGSGWGEVGHSKGSGTASSNGSASSKHKK